MSRKSEETPIIVQKNFEGSTKNALGLKSREAQRERSFFSRLFGLAQSPWISEAPNERMKIKRQAYLEILKAHDALQGDQKKICEDVLCTLNEGSLSRDDEAQVYNLNQPKEIQKLSQALQKQDRLEYAQFAKTLSDAQPYGMVGKGNGRNPHLAEIITLFTYIYEQKPQNNPLLYGFPDQTPEELLASLLKDELADVNDKGLDGALARRKAVERYVDKIGQEIEKIIAMSPQAMGMTFSDDNVKHVAIVRKLKLSFNRLAAELDYGERFTHLTSSKFQTNDYQLLKVEALPPANLEKGKIYLLETGRYAVLDTLGRRIEGDIDLAKFNDANLDLSDGNLKNPEFKEKILDILSARGHIERGEKTDTYKRETYDHSTRYEHEATQAKTSMRRKKRGVLATSIIFSAIVTLGQVAIAVFTATGAFAVLIGISCGVTNIFLFTRDIRGFFMGVIKGELSRGLSWPLKLSLYLWLGLSLATAIVAGGLVMMSLVALFGFAISTAPVWLSIVAGFVSALTVVGMTSIFFQVGAGILKGLRGHTFKSFFVGLKEGIVSYVVPPEYNTDVQNLKAQVKAYEDALLPLEEELTRLFSTQRDSEAYRAVLAKVEYLREQFYPIQGRLKREQFAHYARWLLKLILSPLFAVMAFVAAFLATWGYSVLSVSGTADSFKVFLGLSDKLALGIANALTAISGVVNGVLSTQNLFNVGLLFAGKISKMVVGVLYGVATFCNLIYYGKLWQTIKNSYNAFRANPYKDLTTAVRTGIAMAFGAAIVLNGYGNGATAGGGAINSYYLPTWLLNLVSPSTLTVVMATGSSMALNKAAIDNAFKDATPVLTLENPDPVVPAKPILLPESVVAAGKKRKRNPEGADADAAFFDRCDAFFNAKMRPGAVRASAADLDSVEEYTDDYSSSSGSDYDGLAVVN